MRYRILRWYIPTLLLIIFIAMAVVWFLNETASATNFAVALQERSCIIIDAGHGGVDGGAISCTGKAESEINLQISLTLRDLLHLLGYQTRMIRTTDISVYTGGNTIAQKKISDLKHRVRVISSTQNPILVSIHQNYFRDSQYSGAQVFYGENYEGSILAKQLQTNFRLYLDSSNNRKEKKSKGVYLMEQVHCPAVLIECGFLSNPREEALLRNVQYQQRICGIISVTLALFLDQKKIN